MKFNYSHRYMLTGIDSVGYYRLVHYDENLYDEEDENKDLIHIAGTVYTNDERVDFNSPHTVSGFFQDEEDEEWVLVLNGSSIANPLNWYKSLYDVMYKKGTVISFPIPALICINCGKEVQKAKERAISNELICFDCIHEEDS